MASTFTYRITAFDADSKTVDVTFGDGSWASISLVAPLPTNMNDLDMVVRQYTTTREVAETQAAPAPVDLSYITKSIDAERTANRLSIKGLLNGDPQPVITPPVPVTLEDYKASAKQLIAATRFGRETTPVVLPTGQTINTDRESQAKIIGTFTAMQAGVLTSVNWKCVGDIFVVFDAAQFAVLAATVAQHVQDAFNWEKDALIQVNAASTIDALKVAVQPFIPGAFMPPQILPLTPPPSPTL